MAHPTHSQLVVIEITERLSSVISLLATTFIIVTFLTSRSFRKPINRIVFYVSFGNIITTIPTLISTAGIHAGANSALCQMQGFLIQWFMLADPLFTLAMALNVYLTFFRRYSAEQLRALDMKYVVACYGIPFIPAFTYFFLRTSAGVRGYGPAIIWCWIPQDWNILRVATFYGPIWIVIAITMTIYISTGVVIWRKRRQLRKFSFSASHAGISMMSTRTTEVRVTREVLTSNSEEEERSVGRAESAQDSGNTSHDEEKAESRGADSKRGYRPYTVTINAGPESKLAPPPLPSSNSLAPPGLPPAVSRGGTVASRSRETDDVAWSYARAALSYFIAMIVTWVPSSIYRVHGLVHPGQNPYALMLATSIVLPLQGFWNGLIYVIVSQAACREYFGSLFNAWPRFPAALSLRGWRKHREDRSCAS